MNRTTARIKSIRFSVIVRTALLGLVAIASLAACATAPRRPVSRPLAVAPEPPPRPTQVYFYPTAGQSAAQQERDRYECYNWAVKQTGYDPSLRRPRASERVAIVPQPAPHGGAIAGAATGAVLGAVIAHPGNTGSGAIVGAAAGALVGAAADASQQQQAQAVENHSKRVYRHADDRDAAGYRRAMSACLEGRGYSVK